MTKAQIKARTEAILKAEKLQSKNPQGIYTVHYEGSNEIKTHTLASFRAEIEAAKARIRART